MNEVSDEQKNVIEYIKSGVNVIVDACAGSGKSTTILSTAKDISDKQFLQMTYNSMLRHEVKEKIKAYDLNNIQVHTFHSLAVKYYLPNAYTDSGIRHILYSNIQPVRKIPIFDIIVLDESQDISLLYFQFMIKFVSDMNSSFQLLILGDYMQGLYEFKGSDIRFLTMADIIWEKFPKLKNDVFVKCTLRMSYRITQPMADFVNYVMLGNERLLACREGIPVTYIKNTRTNNERTVVHEISKLLNSGAKPSDFFVLGASVKGITSYIRKMENVLVEQNIPCHVPMFENDKIDDRVIDGKVVFSTFHSVKGRQRKYVFIIGFDNSYFDIYASNLPSDTCPNTLYVGCTRATHGLFLLESADRPYDRPLKFLKYNHHEMKASSYINFKGQPRSIFYENNNKSLNKIQEHHITPTRLIKFLPESVLEEISPILDRIFIKQPTGLSTLDMPTIIHTKNGLYEDVSDINGIAIPCIYYDILTQMWRTFTNNHTDDYESILHLMIKNQIVDLKENEYQFLMRILDDLPNNCDSSSEYLYLANVFIALQEKLYFKLKQIDRDEYNWLTDEIIEQCGERMDSIIGKESDNCQPEIEKTIIHTSNAETHKNIDEFFINNGIIDNKFRFTARVDLITEKSVWEIKCTSSISIDHLLQLVIYAWIWKMLPDNDSTCNKEFKIFNIKTGEILQLNSSQEDLDCIMLKLIHGKYEKIQRKSDSEFVESCLSCYM